MMNTVLYVGKPVWPITKFDTEKLKLCINLLNRESPP